MGGRGLMDFYDRLKYVFSLQANKTSPFDEERLWYSYLLAYVK